MLPEWCTQQEWHYSPASGFVVTHAPLQKTLLEQGPGIVRVHSSGFVKQVSCRLQATNAAAQRLSLSPAMLGVKILQNNVICTCSFHSGDAAFTLTPSTPGQEHVAIYGACRASQVMQEVSEPSQTLGQSCTLHTWKGWRSVTG